MDDRNCNIAHEHQSVIFGEDTLPHSQSIKKGKLLCKKKGHPSERVIERVYFQFFQFGPDSRLNYHQHFVNLVQFSIDSILTFIKIFDVKLYDIRYRIVKHKKYTSLLYLRLVHIHEIENWSQYLIHSLNIKNLWVQLCVDEKNTRHVIISVSFLLKLFVCQKLLILLFIFAINQLELFPSWTCKKWYHNLWCNR